MGETGQDDDWLSVKSMKKKVSYASIIFRKANKSKNVYTCCMILAEELTPMWNRAFRLPHYAIVLWVGTDRQPQSLMIIIIRDLQVLHCMKERRGLAMTLVIPKLILVVLRLLLEIQLKLTNKKYKGYFKKLKVDKILLNLNDIIYWPFLYT